MLSAYTITTGRVISHGGGGERVFGLYPPNELSVPTRAMIPVPIYDVEKVVIQEHICKSCTIESFSPSCSVDVSRKRFESTARLVCITKSTGP